ncbi:MAG TPA: hypothetical protein VGD89_10485, partial [Flavipsychrobacter sp.]
IALPTSFVMYMEGPTWIKALLKNTIVADDLLLVKYVIVGLWINPLSEASSALHLSMVHDAIPQCQ